MQDSHNEVQCIILMIDFGLSHGSGGMRYRDNPSNQGGVFHVSICHEVCRTTFRLISLVSSSGNRFQSLMKKIKRTSGDPSFPDFLCGNFGLESKRLKLPSYVTCQVGRWLKKSCFCTVDNLETCVLCCIELAIHPASGISWPGVSQQRGHRHLTSVLSTAWGVQGQFWELCENTDRESQKSTKGIWVASGL